MQCRECHAELPQGARRCPQCGRPVLHEKIWRNKRLRALLIGIAIVLVAVGAGFAVVASAGRRRQQPRQGSDLQLPV
ncbi:MAG: zinc-ribbon domain-containing protein [Oscillospiraceae bacterium]